MLKIYLKKNDSKVRYAFETIFSILGFPYNFVEKLPQTTDPNNIYIYYGKNDQGKDFKNNSIIIDSVDCDYLNTNNVLRVNFDKKKLPVFYGKAQLKYGKPLYSYEDGTPAVTEVAVDISKQILIGFDLIKTVFFLISRQEEINSQAKDDHDRFPSEESILVKLDLHDIAVIDIYIKLLEKIIINISHENNVPLIKKSLWPNNNKFAVCLTHDVDRIKIKSLYRVSFWISQFIKYLLKHQIKEARLYFSKIKRVLLMKSDSYWNFEKWLELEKKYGVKSSFYFISRSKNITWKNKDLRYAIGNNTRLKRVIKRLISEGWDVGLHGDFDSYLNTKKIFQEKTRIEAIINSKVYGIRQHYLKFKAPTSWQIQEQAGLLYDTTLGWQDRLGFRCGLSFPFYPYDIVNHEKRKILEIPLTIMDGVFLISTFQDKNSEVEVTNECLRFFNNAEKFGSLITLLWHQAVLDEVDYTYFGSVYEKLLQYLQKKEVFVGSGKEIMEWWVQREGVKVIAEEMTVDKVTWKIRADSDINNVSFTITGVSGTKKSPTFEGIDHVKIDDTGIVSVSKIKENQCFKISLDK